MHGLTGGSWKRSTKSVTDTTKNDPWETALVIVASRPTADPCHRASSRPSNGLRAECSFRPDEGSSAARRACRCIGVGSCDEGSVLPKETICTTRTPRDHPLCHARRARRNRHAGHRNAHRERRPRAPASAPARPPCAPRRCWCCVGLGRTPACPLSPGTPWCPRRRYRYLHEGIDVQAAQVPNLHQVLRAGKAAGWTHVTLDGTLTGTDRCRTTKPDTGHDLWFSGKYKVHGGQAQGPRRQRAACLRPRRAP